VSKFSISSTERCLNFSKLGAWILELKGKAPAAAQRKGVWGMDEKGPAAEYFVLCGEKK